MNIHEDFIRRCLQLAKQAHGNVAPNPLVGAVIVHETKNIIGEGFHQVFGQAHAEVNAILSVTDPSLLSTSTLYVNLEPCSHQGKTPPCTDLIISKGIKKVVIGSADSNPLVKGKGIKKLKDAGIEVISGVLENECRELNKRFFTFHEKKRPYVILKWAQTLNNLISGEEGDEKSISNSSSKKLVHKWRSEEQAIMVGTNTVLEDNPELTTREWEGKSPIRIILDRSLKIPADFNVMNDKAPTIIFTEMEASSANNLEFIRIDFGKNLIGEVLDHLYQKNIQSVIVEGGRNLLDAFIETNYWDEAKVFIGNKQFKRGLEAPSLFEHFISEEQLDDDLLRTYKNQPATDR